MSKGTWEYVAVADTKGVVEHHCAPGAERHPGLLVEGMSWQQMRCFGGLNEHYVLMLRSLVFIFQGRISMEVFK